MRRSPRRPLILKRRKLPFQLSDPPSKDPHHGPPPPAPPPPPPPPCPTKATVVVAAFPDGVRVVAHPTRPDTQVVVVSQTADLQCVIGALTAKGKERGPDGPHKFILLTGGLGPEDHPRAEEGGDPPPQRRGPSPGGGPSPGHVKEEEEEEEHPDIKPLTGLNPFNKDNSLDCSPLDDSLTNMQWLGGMSTDKSQGGKENYNHSQQESQASDSVEGGGEVKAAPSDRPPYSYMAMIQFAINSRPDRRMTLKDIYTWIEDHFPFFQQQTKPGWKNSIRHNLSLHDMFTREISPDGKVSHWTILPEANRCLTLDQVYKPGCEGAVTLVPVPRPPVPHQEQTGLLASASGRGARGCVRRMKPLLPRSESYLVPFQLPTAAAAAATTSIFLPSTYPSQVQLRPAPQRTRVTPRPNKRVRIAPKVEHVDAPAVLLHPVPAQELKEEPVCVPLTPRRAPPRGGGGGGSSSRRKQRLVLATHEEPVLLFQDSTFFDSGLASDASGLLQDTQPGGSPPPTSTSTSTAAATARELSFKTPVKGSGSGGSSSSSSSSSSHLASSTPSKPPGWEPWKVTPLGKGTRQAMLDFSPIRTPTGPLHTPQQQRHHHHQHQQLQHQQQQQQQDYSSFSFSGTSFTELPLFSSPRELLASSASCGRDPSSPSPPAAAGRSLEGLMLDSLNDSLSKVLVDISFSCLEDEDLGTANISWSEFIPQML